MRSLGGMISCCGLLDLSDAGLDDKAIWERVDKAFDCYRDYPKHDLQPLDGWKFHNAAGIATARESTTIHFIGVWDTVGALGVPDDLAVLDLIDDPTRIRSSTTRSSENGHGRTPCGRHGRDAQELRTDACGRATSPERDVKQIWFPGVHGDVGGGYLQKRARRWRACLDDGGGGGCRA